MKTHLIILAAALLPTLAIIWHRVSQREEVAGNVTLLLALDDDERHVTSDILPASHYLTSWLAENNGHPHAATVRQILLLRADPQRRAIGLDALVKRALKATLTR